MYILKRLNLYLKILWRKLIYKDDDNDKGENETIEKNTILENDAPVKEIDIDKIFEICQKEKNIFNKRTILTRLYVLEQKILPFFNEFPNEYKNFKKRITLLKENYEINLKELKKEIQFEIDPELDGMKMGQIVKLEKDIEKFLNKEVKFNILSKKLQRFIVKLNILYNVSIFHNSENEKENIREQIEKAIELEEKFLCDFKNCDYILKDNQLKERIITLLCYADYEIFKTSLRISGTLRLPHFEEFAEKDIFETFIKEEVSSLIQLLNYISNMEIKNNLMQKVDKINMYFLNSNNENSMEEISIWNVIFEFENTLLGFLKVEKIENEKIKVGLLKSMKINILEDDVITLPITKTLIELSNLFAKTNDFKVMVLIEVLKNTSSKITYKEIYFLSLLFDIFETIKKEKNPLMQYLEKYDKKYSYSQDVILDKKQLVINSSVKNYINLFTLNGYEKEIIEALKKLNIDFKIEGKKVLINSFYFKNMPNI